MAETQNKYGVWVLHCPCGWTTINKSDSIQVNKCRACDRELLNKAEFSEDVACWVVTLVENRNQRVTELASRQGLYLYWNKNKTGSVYKFKNAASVNFKDGEVRCFNELDLVFGPASYQKIMRKLRELTQDLPDYLKTSD